MKDLKFFLRQNAVLPQNEEVEVTQRFKDENGSPIKFEIKPISNELDDELRKQNTRQVKRAKGVYVPELDNQGYLADMAVRAVVYPDLNDKEFQDSRNVMDAKELLNVMLLPGEYNVLLQAVQKLNGWDLSLDDIKEEAKN